MRYWRLILIYLLSLTAWALSLSAATPYTPKIADPTLDGWRWSHLQVLDNEGFRCMTEDTNGHVWFGLRQGVYQYDGLHWTRHLPQEGLPAGAVAAIYGHRNGAVYVQTDQGMGVWRNNIWTHLAEYKLSHLLAGPIVASEDGSVWTCVDAGVLQIRPTNEIQLHTFPNRIQCLLIDHDQNLWAVPLRSGSLYTCPLEQGQLVPRARWHIHQMDDHPQRSRRCLLQTEDKRLWYISRHHQEKTRIFDPTLGTWDTFNPVPQGGSDSLISALQTHDGAIWFAGVGSLSVQRNGHWHNYDQALPRLPTVLLKLYQTTDGALWIGGVDAEVFRLDYTYQSWKTYRGLLYQDQTKNGQHWYLDAEDGIVKQDRNTWTRFDSQDQVIDSPLVLKVMRDHSIWVAGSHQGRAAIAVYRNGLWTRTPLPQLGFAVSHLSLQETLEGKVLLGAAGNEGWTPGAQGGLMFVTPTEDDAHFEHLKPPQVPYRIAGITPDRDGSLWFGGSSLLHYSNRRFQQISHHPALQQHSWVDHIARHPDGRLWIAKGGIGLLLKAPDTYTLYTTEQGLASNMVSFVLCQEKDAVWAATNRGISRFDGRHWKRQALPAAFRLDRESGSLTLASDGAIWINEASRAWYFRALTPEQQVDTSGFKTTRYKPNTTPPETKLLFYAERVPAPGNAHLSWTGQSAWSQTPPAKMEYAYRLDGGAWSAYAPTTSHTFLELANGTHHFEVRARDRDFNIDPTPASVRFTVTPPLWQEPWFLTVFGLLAAVIVLLLWRLVRQHEKHLVEMEAVKLRLFTNVSHELRTPLTVILGPLQSLLQKTQDAVSRQHLLTMQRNAQRLLHLVDELLDFRKLQSGQLQVETTDADLANQLRDIFTSLRPLADEKQMTYTLTGCPDSFPARYDPDKLQKILTNLLSNAIKYTPPGGKVTLAVDHVPPSLEDDTHSICIRVEDTGPGIPKSEQPQIFNRFYRAADGPSTTTKGTGIGLALSLELIELCNGSIELTSPVPDAPPESPGTRFTLHFPVTGPLGTPVSPPASESPQTQAPPQMEERERERPLLLFVEDNADVRSFLRLEMNNTYEILEAEDGVEGLEQARTTIPDLIVADIMMPRMDGLEMCQHLKTEEATSHIPVIILTARQSQQHELEGLETGADDYVTKPFQIDILKARIHNLLESRRKLRERFTREVILQPKEIAVTSADERFLTRAMDILEQNIAEENFDIDVFADKMNMSRSTLYRKLKAVCDQSPATFIRSFQLKRAADLLKTGELNVSEVAFRVGFQDLSYFSKCFKEQFHCTPSQYAQQKP